MSTWNSQALAEGNIQRIYLCGMPAVGKTTFGKKLASALGWTFVDLDLWIEQRKNATVAELFASGESTFRAAEREACLASFTLDRHVISLGGGALQDDSLTQQIKDHGLLVHLQIPREDLITRLLRNQRRPMFKGLSRAETAQKVTELWQVRKSTYRQAHAAWNPIMGVPAVAESERFVHGSLRDSMWLQKWLPSPSVGRFGCIIDERVAQVHSDLLGELTQHPQCLGAFTVPSGEASKSVEQWQRLSSELLEAGCQRSDTLLILGGGVTGDVGGFVASTLMRGVRTLQIPTTLLAMVDSAIGGKTGINHTKGKNLLGTFSKADAVLFDMDLLSTLPREEWVNGTGEILKYGFIADPTLLEELSSNAMPDLEPNTQRQIIQRCADIKALIVAKDYRESGQRMFLNFGHTFGHALEHVAGYGALAHGLAVMVGMKAAIWLSNQRGASIQDDVIDMHLPDSVQEVLSPMRESMEETVEALVAAMGADKKATSSGLRLILLDQLAEPVVVEDCTKDELMRAWTHALA
ncbi:MAG: 3-dehydroquinate synthase [Balneolaceae bacterium]|nr:3-dehydroquinate synthase [Balneolaceae bacterium]